MQGDAVRQCDAVHCSALQCVAVCLCVAVRCSALQCVAVCCSVHASGNMSAMTHSKAKHNEFTCAIRMSFTWIFGVTNDILDQSEVHGLWTVGVHAFARLLYVGPTGS